MSVNSVTDTVGKTLDNAKDTVNKAFEGMEPWQIALAGASTGVAAVYGSKLAREVRKKGFKKVVLGGIVKKLKAFVPGVQAHVDAQVQGTLTAMEHGLLNNNAKKTEPFHKLPEKGRDGAELIAMLEEWKKEEDSLWKSGRVSGAVYHGGDELKAISNKAMSLFSLTNPLHPDLFPYVRKMESEVVAMTAEMFNGTETTCGVMTSGGTESILMAIKAYRDRALEEKGITEPNIVIPTTAHAAFDKGCHYFGVELIHVPVSQETFCVDPADVRKAINENTIMIVGSAVNFPQGTLDPIEALAEIALEKNIGLHVDCCLGSFLIAFVEEVGYKLPPFDFRVKGVTTISTDSHKFGFAPKGSSILLYSTPKLRQYQYFVAEDWTGGVYACPSVAGSRPGGIIAGTWATMVAMGADGYREAARKIMKASKEIERAIREDIPELRVLGQPATSVVSFAGISDDQIDIYKVGEAMGNRKWSLNTLQAPRSLHICVTFLSADVADQFISDLKDSVAEVVAHPERFRDGSAAMYGSAETVADRSIIADIAKGFVDILYKKV